MGSMKIQRLGSAHHAAVDGNGSRARPNAPATTPPFRSPVAQLPGALQILAIQLHEAVRERRAALLGSDRYQRADERVAYINELYVRLQHRMEVPAEIWLLGGGQAPVRGQQPRGRHRR